GSIRCQVKDVLAEQRFPPRENEEHLRIHLGNLIHHPPTLSRRQLMRRICTGKGAHITVRTEEIALLSKVPRDGIGFVHRASFWLRHYNHIKIPQRVQQRLFACIVAHLESDCSRGLEHHAPPVTGTASGHDGESRHFPGPAVYRVTSPGLSRTTARVSSPRL